MPISELVNDILEHCDIYQKKKKKNGVNKKGGGGGDGGEWNSTCSWNESVKMDKLKHTER